MTLEELIAQQKEKPKRKRLSDKEHQLQRACVQWFNLKYSRYRGLLFAIPNGGWRDIKTASRLKQEGVVAGVADLILLIPNRYYGALLIEMKTPEGKQSAAQRKWQQAVTAQGDYKYIVCRKVEQFIEEVQQYIENI